MLLAIVILMWTTALSNQVCMDLIRNILAEFDRVESVWSYVGWLQIPSPEVRRVSDIHIVDRGS